jgi:hypothetical protein
VSGIAAIGPARVAGIRPVQPGPTDDPSEDGLEVEAIFEPTMVMLADRVAAPATAGDAQLDLSGRAYAANAASTVRSLHCEHPPRPGNQTPRGNTAVTTGFDQRPALDLGHAPRGNFATPFARALNAYSGR